MMRYALFGISHASSAALRMGAFLDFEQSSIHLVAFSLQDGKGADRRAASVWLQGWPVHTVPLEVRKGQEIIVTTDETTVASSSKLPITYPHFAHMCQAGDSLFVGRYLVNGADQSSLYLEASRHSLSYLHSLYSQLHTCFSATSLLDGYEARVSL